jgi:hypothetical protein
LNFSFGWRAVVPDGITVDRYAPKLTQDLRDEGRPEKTALTAFSV